MGISITPKTDYSYLFSGLSTGSAASTSNFLADYASIKNGSYAKLMKAYYSEADNKSVNSIVKQQKTEDDSKTLTAVKSASDALKESADALLVKGSKSVFEGEDKEKIYKAVDAFVKDYNAMLDALDDVNNKSILSKGVNLTNSTKINEKLLTSVGISIESDNSLSIDKEMFEKSNMSTVKTLFQGNGSYAYRVSAQASMINFTAEREATKAPTYTVNGTYGYNNSTGNLFDSWF